MNSLTIEDLRVDAINPYINLFNNNSKLIFKLIYNFIMSKNIKLNQHDIDDIYQDVALKIIKNDYLARYKTEKSALTTWLNIICRTTAIDYYRKKMRLMETVLDGVEPDPEEAAPEMTEFTLPTDVLTDRQAEILTLFFKHGLEAAEIAARLDISPRTVRSIKFQALERIRNHFGVPATAPQTGEEPQDRRKMS